MKINLERCPLCGNEVSIGMYIQNQYYIRCDECGLETRIFENLIDLLNYWNTRYEAEDV